MAIDGNAAMNAFTAGANAHRRGAKRFAEHDETHLASRRTPIARFITSSGRSPLPLTLSRPFLSANAWHPSSSRQLLDCCCSPWSRKRTHWNAMRATFREVQKQNPTPLSHSRDCRPTVGQLRHACGDVDTITIEAVLIRTLPTVRSVNPVDTPEKDQRDKAEASDSNQIVPNFDLSVRQAHCPK